MIYGDHYGISENHNNAMENCDHYGISENHNNAMEKLLGEKITPAKFMDLNRTGFWLKIPGKEGTVDKTYAGQMDVMPTILHLVGIDSKTS